MAWKGIRKGNFKNLATERVSGWKVGDLVHIDEQCLNYIQEWKQLSKIGIIKRIDDKTRHVPYPYHSTYYNIQNKNESYYPTYKTNGKYKEILIQFGNVEHKLYINDNAESDGDYPPLISPRDAEIKGKLLMKGEQRGLDFGANLHTSLRALEDRLVADCFQSRDNIRLSELQGSRDECRAVFDEGFDTTILGEASIRSSIDSVPYIDINGLLSIRDTINVKVSEELKTHLPERDDMCPNPYLKHVCGLTDNALSEMFTKHNVEPFPNRHIENWFWDDNNNNHIAVNIKRSWAFTDEGLQLKKMRLFTCEKSQHTWKPISKNEHWDMAHPLPVYGEDEQPIPFNKDFLRIGGEWIPQDKE